MAELGLDACTDAVRVPRMTLRTPEAFRRGPPVGPGYFPCIRLPAEENGPADRQ